MSATVLKGHDYIQNRHPQVSGGKLKSHFKVKHDWPVLLHIIVIYSSVPRIQNQAKSRSVVFMAKVLV